MNNRINEIEARLEAADCGPWARYENEYRIIALDPNDSKFAYDIADVYSSYADADLIAHAPSDLRYLLSEIKWERSVMEDEVFDLRDQINALWDILWSLTDGNKVDEISDLYLKRVAIQKEMRTGRGIKNIASRIAEQRREALEQLAKISEELPGGYLGNTDKECFCDAEHIDFCICEYGEFDEEE